jgi:hypothetical protein
MTVADELLASGSRSTAEALALFDRLPAATLEAVSGWWRGSGLPTDHPLDGLLEAYGWYGKAFIDADTVHPLLFRDGQGAVHPLNPRLMPIGMAARQARLLHHPAARAAFGLCRPLLRTRRPAARLRPVEHRGVVSAAMIYDALPIIDHLRAAGPDTLLGLMDLRGLDRPFFFLLRRDAAPPP